MDVRAITKSVQKLSVSNIHSGIICDKCDTESIEGFRYACLVCEDYDLCTECYQKKSTSGDHLAFHPMLPILAPGDLAKALKNLTPSQIKIFSCPYCGDGDLAIGKLAAHCLEYHSYKGGKVRCPICVTFSVPDKKRWIAEDTLLLHLLIKHQNKDGYVLDLSGSECSVCFEQISADENKQLVCGHVFHGNCINRWLRNKSTCPMCRKDVGSNRNRTTDSVSEDLHEIEF
ncbi:potassium channel modulatory factor 1 [Culex quinquefasciatus]|uniref:Potassium channel modulatory factor 1 n=1 Tax=Culex quinquefasciatus TaxID=7176 RepID=B0WBB4_CULQU|nr:potassium channel modulatory factor 1 [Culex quinquefasciatus]|eukprot:XP_001845998.1 potassium channel modulatory factor 1 [Culex quinquefasciatus]